MSSIRVNQPVSLTTVYDSQPVAPKSGSLNGRNVEQRTDGHSRVDANKTTWQRFVSRNSHRLSQFADVFTSKDRTANREADRFNHRHEKFSAKIENLVNHLKAGSADKLADPDYVATLRNDVKLMHRDMPWAARKSILEKRMDVELSKLSSDELAQVRGSLLNVDESSLTSKDKTDLRTLKMSVLRQEIARSEKLCDLVGKFTVDLPDPRDVRKMLLEVASEYNSGMLSFDLFSSVEDGVQMIRDATPLLIRRDPALDTEEVLKQMNVTFLDLGLRQDDPKLGRNNVNLLVNAFGKGIREEMLRLVTPQDYTDKNLYSRFKVLGQGAVHTVSKGVYADPAGNHQNATQSKVHKYDDDTIRTAHGDYFLAPNTIRIDHDDPRLLERSVFASKIDEFLGLGVCVKTDLAYHHDCNGIVMDLAKGSTAGKFPGGADVRDANFKRSMCALQLFDCVIGQADRHLGNYMVESRNGIDIDRVVAIDNDFSMGELAGTMENLIGRTRAFHYLGAPPVIDQPMADAIAKLTPQKLEELTDGLFSTKAVDALKERVKDLQDRISTGNIRVIDPQDWGTRDVEADLNGTRGTRETPMSYWGRDQEHLARFDFGL